MKTKFALIVAISLFAETGFGQETSATPSPASVSTAPRRYTSAEMARFRALRTASYENQADANGGSTGSGIQMSLGDSDQSLSSDISARQTIQPTSYVRDDKSAKPASTKSQEPAPVPEILAGKKPANITAPTSSNMMPSEISMNQPMTRPTSGAAAGGKSASSAFQMTNSPAVNKTPAQSTTKIQTKPKSEVFSLAPTMPQPGQPPVDLRQAAPPTYQASRPSAMPGRVVTASAKQETLETLTPDAASTTKELPLTAPVQSATTSAANSTAKPSTTILPSQNPAVVSPTTTSPLRSPAQNLTAASSRTSGQDTNQTTINSPGASIEVATTGPKTISVGKSASYGIEVANTGRTAAQQLVVTFTVPTWIELANTNLTTGSKELVRETDATRIMWRIDRLEAGKSQRLTLDVIPRKAQVFDLNVEWSVAPLAGAVQVQVTEPLIKMAITGPDEVQFGQSALYNVTIRNPGTGVAENVNVMLSEVLGGERAALGNLGPGEEKNIQVELIARSAGALDLSATVSGDGNLQDGAAKKITVRRAEINISLAGPALKYAGSTANFQITVENTGDAIAQDVFAAIGLPSGVNYLSGIEAAERIEGGMRWAVGALPPGAKRTYTIACQLNTAGPIQIEAGARGTGDLADADTIQTMVETVADLVLTVEDPQGPLPIGQDVTYKIVVKNRGSKAASNLDLVMHFSNGVEPTSAEGRNNKINPGEVVFETISQLDPTEEMVFNVTARANTAGAHMFRAQLICSEADAREVAQGTTKFFGDDTAEVKTTEPTPAINVGESPFQNGMR